MNYYYVLLKRGLHGVVLHGDLNLNWTVFKASNSVFIEIKMYFFELRIVGRKGAY